MPDKDNSAAEAAKSNKIRVKALRPVYIPPDNKDDEDAKPVVLLKGATGEVTKKQFDRHSNLLEKIAAISVLFLMLLLAVPAQAQSYGLVAGSFAITTSANSATSWGTSIPSLTNNAESFGWTNNSYTNAAGVLINTPVTNSIPNATTNVIASAPVAFTKYDEIVLNLFYSQLTNTSTGVNNTNWFGFGFSSDGINFTSTNTPVLVIPVATLVTNTNALTLVLTNLSRNSTPAVGSYGYIQWQTWGNQGTNTSTNGGVSIWVKPKRQG